MDPRSIQEPRWALKKVDQELAAQSTQKTSSVRMLSQQAVEVPQRKVCHPLLTKWKSASRLMWWPLRETSHKSSAKSLLHLSRVWLIRSRTENATNLGLSTQRKMALTRRPWWPLKLVTMMWQTLQLTRRVSSLWSVTRLSTCQLGRELTSLAPTL